MEQNTIAAVGEMSSVIVFHTAGIKAVGAESPEEARRAIMELVRDNTKIIYLTENYFEALPDLIEKYRASAYPVIIPIPDRTGSRGLGEKKVISNMEKAIGTNIFDK
jgi:V/A-type H+-transporting ATPase subunit F